MKKVKADNPEQLMQWLAGGNLPPAEPAHKPVPVSSSGLMDTLRERLNRRKDYLEKLPKTKVSESILAATLDDLDWLRAQMESVSIEKISHTAEGERGN